MRREAAVPRFRLCQGLESSMQRQLWPKAVTKEGEAAHQVSANLNMGTRGQPLCEQEGIVMIVLQPLCRLREGKQT